MLVNQGGTIEIDYRDDGSPGPGRRRTLDSTAAITANQWYHIVGVIRGPTDMSIYINGVDAAARTPAPAARLRTRATPERLTATIGTTHFFPAI